MIFMAIILPKPIWKVISHLLQYWFFKKTNPEAILKILTVSAVLASITWGNVCRFNYHWLCASLLFSVSGLTKAIPLLLLESNLQQCTHSHTTSNVNSWPWQLYISAQRTAVCLVHTCIGRAYLCEGVGLCCDCLLVKQYLHVHKLVSINNGDMYKTVTPGL